MHKYIYICLYGENLWYRRDCCDNNGNNLDSSFFKFQARIKFGDMADKDCQGRTHSPESNMCAFAHAFL